MSTASNKQAGPGFLDLALETREEIYRDLLIGVRVSKRIPNPAYHNSPEESEPLVNAPRSDDDEIGKIGCQNVFIHTFDFQVSILRTNRQIYNEAKRLMYAENVWIHVKVNKAGFGRDMKEHGFAVIASRGVHYPKPIVRVKIHYLRLDNPEYETFLMTDYGFYCFPRALWGIGMKEMVIFLDFHPLLIPNPFVEDLILEPFYELHGIFRFFLTGARQQRHITGMPSALETPYADSRDVWKEFEPWMAEFSEYLDEGNIEAGAMCLQGQLALLADCCRFPGLAFLEANQQVYRQIRRAVVQIALNLARARQMLGEYNSALKYTEYAAKLCPIEGRNREFMTLTRGQAFLGLGQKRNALRELLGAADRDAGSKLITDAISSVMKSLDPDPIRAFKAFKDLRVSIDKENEQER
jgi:hypothetical protein